MQREPITRSSGALAGGHGNFVAAENKKLPEGDSNTADQQKVLEILLLREQLPADAVGERNMSETGPSAVQHKDNNDNAAHKDLSLDALVHLPPASIETNIMNMEAFSAGRTFSFMSSLRTLEKQQETDPRTAQVAMVRSLLNGEGGLRNEAVISDLSSLTRCAFDEFTRRQVLQMIAKTRSSRVLQFIADSPVVHEIRNWFEEAVTDDTALQLELVEVAGHLPISIKLLRSTRFGILVKKARNSQHKDVRRLAKQVYLQLRDEITKETGTSVTQKDNNGECSSDSVSPPMAVKPKEPAPGAVFLEPDGAPSGAPTMAGSGILAQSADAYWNMHANAKPPRRMTSDAEQLSVLEKAPSGRMSCDPAWSAVRHTEPDCASKAETEPADHDAVLTRLDKLRKKVAEEREKREQELLEREREMENKKRNSMASPNHLLPEFGPPPDTVGVTTGMGARSTVPSIASSLPRLHEDCATAGLSSPAALKRVESPPEGSGRDKLVFDDLLDLTPPQLGPPVPKTTTSKGGDDLDVAEVTINVGSFTFPFAPTPVPKRGILKMPPAVDSIRGNRSVRFRPDHNLVEVHVIEVSNDEEEETVHTQDVNEGTKAIFKRLLQEDVPWKLPRENSAVERYPDRSKETRIQKRRNAERPEVVYRLREDIPMTPNEGNVEVCDDMYVRKIPIENAAKIPSSGHSSRHQGRRSSRSRHDYKRDISRCGTSAGLSRTVSDHSSGLPPEKASPPGIQMSSLSSVGERDSTDGSLLATPFGVALHGRRSSTGDFSRMPCNRHVPQSSGPARPGSEEASATGDLQPAAPSEASPCGIPPGRRATWTLSARPAAAPLPLATFTWPPPPPPIPTSFAPIPNAAKVTQGVHDSLANIFDMINRVGCSAPPGLELPQPPIHQPIPRDQTAVPSQPMQTLRHASPIAATSSLLKRAREMLVSSSRSSVEPADQHFEFGVRRDSKVTSEAPCKQTEDGKPPAKRQKLSAENRRTASPQTRSAQTENKSLVLQPPGPSQFFGGTRKKKLSQRKQPPVAASQGTASSQRKQPPVAPVQESASSQRKQPPVAAVQGTASSQRKQPPAAAVQGTTSSQRKQPPAAAAQGTASSQRKQLPVAAAQGTESLAEGKMSSAKQTPAPMQSTGKKGKKKKKSRQNVSQAAPQVNNGKKGKKGKEKSKKKT